MTRTLYRLGGAAAAHPGRTLGIWLVVVAIAAGLAGTVGGTPQDDWNVPGTASQEGTDLLREEFPAASGAVDRVVVHDPDGDPVEAAEITDLSERLADLPHVLEVFPPRVSAGGATVLIQVRYDVPVTHEDIFGDLTPLEEAAEPTVDAGLQVAFGGEVPDSASLAPGGTGEVVGVAVALLLLVLTFGSVVAAGLPIVVALLGLGLAGLQTYATFGIATAIGVVSVMVAALSVVPAVVGLAGIRARGRARPGGPAA